MWSVRRVHALFAIAILAAAVLSAEAQAPRSGSRAPTKRGAKSAKPASAWPAFESRHAEWVHRKEIAAEAGTTGPDPLSQYLVNEVVVTGVFDTDTGYGVFLHAIPTGTTFFVAAGAALYNGRLAEINPGASGFVEDTEIVFLERAGKAASDRRIVKRVEPTPGREAAAPPEG